MTLVFSLVPHVLGPKYDRRHVSDGVERQGYRHGPVRTVTMYELAGGVNARFGRKRGVGEGTPTGPRMLTVSYLRWST